MENEYTRIVISLFAVLVLLLMFVFSLKKFRLAKYAKNKDLKIMNIIPIGSKEKIMLVEVNHTILLLGVTSNHIETLYVFKELESVQPRFETPIGKMVEKDAFADQMTKFINNRE